MNADEILVRLKMFPKGTPVSVAIPMGPGGGDGHRLMSILAVHHHGLAKNEIDHDRGGVEIFTPPWDDSGNYPTATTNDIIARLEKHHDEAHVRVGVPWEPDPSAGDRDHHRILMVETIGFAKEAVPVDGKLPIELITEPWDSLSMITRSLTV